MMNDAYPITSCSCGVAKMHGKGYHHYPLPSPVSHHHPHHIKQDFPTPPHLAALASAAPLEAPHQGNEGSNLDGMSALLKAGKIVDRRMQ
jgi:hypothetical protein